MVTWPVQLDTERHYLPTVVVPVYLLTFACFQTARLARAGTRDGSSLHRVDLILRLLGLLTLQHRGFCGLTRSATMSALVDTDTHILLDQDLF